MELATLAHRHYPGYRHEMFCDTQTVLDGNRGRGSRYRLLLVEQGTGLIEVGGRTYPVTAPALYCLNEASDANLGKCSQLVTKTLYFKPTAINNRFTFENLSGSFVLHGSDYQDLWNLDPFREHNVESYGCIPIDQATTRHVSRMFDQIADLLLHQNDEHWPCRSRSYLMELLFLINRIYRQAAAPPELPIATLHEKVQPVIVYLYMNYQNKIMLEQLAKEFHTNKTTLNSLFRASTGMSVMAYLGSIRMQIAASFLRNTLLPTDDIVWMVGMKDDAHFIRSFRNYAGCTPSEYRRMHCWMVPQSS